jgi:DNA-directed RNA polymerase subunit RPC12/RpoP
MAKPDLLVACPRCQAWPMATGGPLNRRYGEMLFQCPRCRHREIFNLKAPLPSEGFVHRPYDAKDGPLGRDWWRPTIS